MSRPDGRATVFAVGDVFLNSPDGAASFRALTPLLSSADLVFGNCEGVYCDRPSPSPSRRHYMGAPASRGAMLGRMPLHVMTCANNHMLDGGYPGLRDTLDLLRDQDIAVTGAGEDIAEATSPAILDAGGRRVAFLGFCSVFPIGYEARDDRAGLAPLRVHTFYADPDPNFWEPAIDPQVTTVPLGGDRERFRTAIRAAAEVADSVVVACHWGYSSRLEALYEYELELARDAVDHGADAVVCHHHHSLRGIEVHRGRPIYYGLGALIHHFEKPGLSPAEVAARRAKLGRLAAFDESPEFPLFPFHPDARMTGVAVLDFEPDGGLRSGLIPAQILADGSTEPLRVGDERASRIHEYVARLSAQSGFDTRFELGERDGWALVRATAGPDAAETHDHELRTVPE